MKIGSYLTIEVPNVYHGMVMWTEGNTILPGYIYPAQFIQSSDKGVKRSVGVSERSVAGYVNVIINNCFIKTAMVNIKSVLHFEDANRLYSALQFTFTAELTKEDLDAISEANGNIEFSGIELNGNPEVISMDWDDKTQLWHITVEVVDYEYYKIRNT